MKSQIVVAQQFRGPPDSGNGGYVCGLMARSLEGVVTASLRAPPPLDTPLDLIAENSAVRLTGKDGTLIGEAKPGSKSDLPHPPQAPSFASVEAAGRRFPGLERRFHPVCFTCGDLLEDGFGLRVFAGQVDDMPDGVVAGPWTVHDHFVDETGEAPIEVIWAAMDCPGSVSWVVQGAGAGLLGTMSAEVLHKPAVGQATIVMGWPIEQSGRKRISGTAIYSQEGELMAHSRQIWISLAPKLETSPIP